MARRTKVKKQRTQRVEIRSRLGQWRQRIEHRRREFLRRRPHRSFRLTQRRDYARSLVLPGYWTLTLQTMRFLLQHWRLFMGLAAVYGLLVVIVFGLSSQETYQQLKELTDQAQEDGIMTRGASFVALFLTAATSHISHGAVSDVQRLLGVLLLLFGWLTTIWLARAVLLGRHPRLRDGWYNAGAPIAALTVLAIVGLIQLLPAAMGLVAYGALNEAGILHETPMLMLSGGAAILLVTLSLYWGTATLFASVIVLLPGMYPLQALKMASDVVVGRRIRVLLRLVWLGLVLALWWTIVLVPAILVDGLLRQVLPEATWLPIVPLSVVAAGSCSLVFAALYVYLFYRKVVADDSAPA